MKLQNAVSWSDSFLERFHYVPSLLVYGIVWQSYSAVYEVEKSPIKSPRILENMNNISNDVSLVQNQTELNGTEIKIA